MIEDLSHEKFLNAVQNAQPFDPEQCEELAQVLTTPVMLSALREILLQSDNTLGMIKAVDFSHPAAMTMVADLKSKALGYDAAVALLYNITEIKRNNLQSATENE